MAAWLGAAMVTTGAILAYVNGYRINVTASVPIGVWKEQPGAIVRGAVVSLCPPDTALFRRARTRGYLAPGACPGDFRPMLKPVVAIAGDVVAVSPAGLAVNGLPLANSAQIARDAAGRRLPWIPAGQSIVRPGDVWLVSSYNRASFDGRYFGPVSLAQVQAVARPVLVDQGRP